LVSPSGSQIEPPSSLGSQIEPSSFSSDSPIESTPVLSTPAPSSPLAPCPAPSSFLCSPIEPTVVPSSPYPSSEESLSGSELPISVPHTSSSPSPSPPAPSFLAPSSSHQELDLPVSASLFCPAPVFASRHPVPPGAAPISHLRRHLLVQIRVLRKSSEIPWENRLLCLQAQSCSNILRVALAQFIQVLTQKEKYIYAEN
jgi:hypothetical protein